MKGALAGYAIAFSFKENSRVGNKFITAIIQLLQKKSLIIWKL